MEHSPELLISQYEAEKKKLQKLIRNCVKEMEYLEAHHHSRALSRLNQRLRTLYKLTDNLYEKKEYAQRNIRFYEKLLKDKKLLYAKEYFEESLHKSKEELEKLNLQPVSKPIQQDPDLFQHILEKLLANSIKDLKLILNKQQNIHLNITYSRKTLKVTIPHIKKLLEKHVWNEFQIHHLLKSGFESDHNGTRLTLILKGEKQQILSRLHYTIGKIVFEIFDFRDFTNESYLHYNEVGNQT
ncbi:hypothetical protein ACR782_13175 [Sphingobacterium spiritivorum]|uniref:hypothetical protein n=1 Tax=Sphingobacterium spiritivorum TaxID=258 RepID=UPI003DA456C5